MRANGVIAPAAQPGPLLLPAPAARIRSRSLPRVCCSAQQRGDAQLTHAATMERAPASAEIEPLAPDVAALVEAAGYDMSVSGLASLPLNATRLKALDKKANKVEKVKNKKDGSRMWTEVAALGELVRSGQATWEDLDLDDIDTRLKWAGLFHRRKRVPGTFMMRLKVPNGELNAQQLRFLGDAIAPFGEAGCGDITTRANVQLRGMTLAEADQIFAGLQRVGLSSVQTGMDNVRNMTGSPIAGIDPHEFLDVRPLNYQINDMITGFGCGNPLLANLPRKINIALSPSRDDFPHTHINDVGLVAVRHPDTGEVGFNLEVGGYFSIKRNAVSIWGDTFIRQDQAVAYCKALLEVFRDHGGRVDRQKARLMWLVEEWGVDRFREMIEQQMGDKLAKGVHAEYGDVWERRDVLGVHSQKQPGLFWVGACVPAGRLTAEDFHTFADVAEKYGDGTMRVTVEQDVLFPNVPEANLEAMQKMRAGLLQEPIFQKFQIEAGNLMRGLVSCTGAQFCGIAMIETKNRAMAIVEKLEQQLDLPKKVRMHWTGCPNSCGQAQVGDIGLMGGPAKLDGKAVEGVRIMVGGTIGERAQLAAELEKGVPCEEEILLPKLRSILMETFGATLKPGVVV